MRFLWILPAAPVILMGLAENTSAAGWYPYAPPLMVPAPPSPVLVMVPPPPPPPPLPPAPPTPPPPPPQPQATSFSVFYDFDKANLTVGAQAAIAGIVQAAKSNRFSQVRITGHADAVGSESYNQGLSLERAKSVRDEMISDGMDGSAISISGRSFHEQMAPTAPGVREPQNRRAVIDLVP